MLSGLILGAIAVVAGIALSGASLRYFLQPSSALIVLGGTLGIALVTSPKDSLRMVWQRVRDLAERPRPEREALIEEMVELARLARRGGLLGIEGLVLNIANSHLREGLMTALDVREASELQLILENELKLAERHGQADANLLETAAGYAPTIGILGTVVGLIECLQHFSDVRSIGPGIGAAFVSTIYGLSAANFLLLPIAHRILVRVAEAIETREMIAEGVVCIFASMHPTIVRQRLAPYLRETEERNRVLNFQRRVEAMNPHAGIS